MKTVEIKTEEKVVTEITAVEVLGNIKADVIRMMENSLVVNRVANSFARDTLKLIKDMVLAYPILKTAEEYHEFNQIFGDLLLQKNSATEDHITLVRNIRGILSINDVDKKKEWYAVLAKIQSGSSVTLTTWKSVVQSYKAIEEGKKLLPDYDFKAEIENVLVQDMDKNIEILMPKKSVGQLYPTPLQVEEMKPTAKKTISYGREAKKLGSKIGGLLKQYEGQEVTRDNKKEIVEFLAQNLDTLIDGYIDEKEGKEKDKNVSKAVLEDENKALKAELEALKASNRTAVKKSKKVA